MILEISDITGQEKAVGHFDIPPDTTLGDLLARDPKLTKLHEFVAYADINGQRIENWVSLSPRKGDRVNLKIKPGPFLVPFIPIIIQALQIISALASIVQFAMSLFAKPSTPHTSATRRKDSQTYTFDGIRTGYQAGNPVSPIYGQHRTGGQLLQMAVDVTSGGKRQELSMLIGLGEGVITDVSCVEINNIAIANIMSTTTDLRLGTQTQSVIPGFNQIRNTFFDGRQFTDGAITYTTQGNQVQKAEVNVSALEGLFHSDLNSNLVKNRSRYSIEYKNTAASTFTIVESPRDFVAKSATEVFDQVKIDFGSLSSWDIRLTWLSATFVGVLNSKYRLWLKNVTEIREQTHTYSSTALLAVRAIATSQLNGAQPQVTAVVRGLEVDQLGSNLAVASHGYTQNPAWHLLDYMTNSRYGAGAYIPRTDLNLQSFYDFSVLCNSQTPNGAGGLEDMHHMDLVMDRKMSHWDWIQNILANYRSTLIWSNGEYKIITDRADTPVRQVFHAGNTIREKTSVKMDSDPTRPNQVTCEFANQSLDYEMDTLFAQDSSAVAANEPIKNIDLSLIGVVRQSEILRAADYYIRRHRDRRRTVSFATGLEGIAVEPGDFAKVGVLTTDWEAGYGGRALDGSSSYILLDREVSLANGNAYELLVWHSKTDSVETITLPSASNTGTIISLTCSFGAQVFPADRWAVGITSEDLMKVRITNVKRNIETGVHDLVGEEFLQFEATTPTNLSSGTVFKFREPPAQPVGVSVTERAVMNADGSVVSRIEFNVTPSPLIEAGRITQAGTQNSVNLGAASHNPMMHSLEGERLRFLSGSASTLAQGYLIETWNSSTTVASVTPPFTLNPTSGDPYELLKKSGTFGGFDAYIDDTGSNQFVYYGSFPGYEGAITVTPQSATMAAKIIPYSDIGVRNEVGPWVVPFDTRGDTVAPAQPSSIFFRRGTGLDVTVQVIPTSQADLWGHLFYRNTVNCFTSAQTIGFGSQMYHDSNISYETTYYYYAAPVDYSFNVGSWVGPTTTVVVSRIVNTDIGTGEITTSNLTANANAIALSSGTIVISRGISIAEGIGNAAGIAVSPKITLFHDGTTIPGLFPIGKLDLIRNGLILDTMQAQLSTNSGDSTVMATTYLDNPTSTSVAYSLVVASLTSVGSMGLLALDRTLSITLLLK